MKKTNLQLLTRDDLIYLNNKYTFDIKDDFIIVSNTDYTRLTCHDINKKFSLNTKVKKVTITPQAIEIWKNCRNKDTGKSDFTLFEVQDAINSLILTYQQPIEEYVKKELQRRY